MKKEPILYSDPLISFERPRKQPAPLTRNTQIADLAGGVAKAKTTDILICT